MEQRFLAHHDVDAVIGERHLHHITFDHPHPALETAPPSRIRVFPNPVRVTTTLSFDLPAATSLTIQIFDVAGRRVLAATSAPLHAGPAEWRLDAARR